MKMKFGLSTHCSKKWEYFAVKRIVYKFSIGLRNFDKLVELEIRG